MNRANSRQIKVAIIGAGASGIVTAIKLSKKFGGQNVCLIERNSRIGKKLLSTGNGQCNLSNKDVNLSNFHGKNPQFAYDLVTKYDYNDFTNFLNELGVLTVVDGFKLYPYSKQASSVLDALRFKLDSLGVNIYLDSKVVALSKQNLFTITLENGQTITAENVVVAVGGKSASFLGTDGSSYGLLTKFGHTLTSLNPAIVQLKVDKNKIKGLKGLKQKALVKALHNGKVLASFNGDVLFQEGFISGNAIFYVSSYLTGKDNSSVQIDFISNYEEDYIIKFLTDKAKKCNYLTCEYLFGGIVNNKIASFILKNELNVNLNDQITTLDIPLCVKTLKNYKLKIFATANFDASQVTNGGILTEEFNQETLESKLCNGLYATGEVLDIDGDCGGYNLQFAYSTACAVAEGVK
ncbi:MAG: aminoacetone oxidase family FAD-binding enzyme [Clostridia bacterium]|nr:aminoacetone oxidase family FAD-binding enzyme [Clostridia bacterium]